MPNNNSIYYQFYPTPATEPKCELDGAGIWQNTNCSSGVNNTAECETGFINAMCKNKSLYDKLSGSKTVYNGEDEHYANVMSKYKTEVLTAFNLGIGILLGTVFLYKI